VLRLGMRVAVFQYHIRLHGVVLN